MKTITKKRVREAVAGSATDIIRDFTGEPDTDRETLIERIDADVDSMFGHLVQEGYIGNYTVHDLAATAQPCSVILQVADADAWIETPGDMVSGLGYGVLASVAFSSLHNLLYRKLSNLGHDSKHRYPFAVDDESEATL